MICPAVTSAVTSAVTTDGHTATTAIVMTVGRVNLMIGTAIVMTGHDRIVTMTDIAPIVIVIATARTGTAGTATHLIATVRTDTKATVTATATAMQAAPIRARTTEVLPATITATFTLPGLLNGGHPALRKRCTTNQGVVTSATSSGAQ